MSDTPSWVRGDHFGLRVPAHPAALREGGEIFLTQALRAAGTLAGDNRVTRIVTCEACEGGSTGRKLKLSVEYAHAADGLHRELFVKFSRDFDDPVRDRGRTQMEGEVRLALLSRRPDFPVTVPVCLFADYEAASGTGLLITERIAFGRDGIEPQYGKCRDEELPDPLAHYTALLESLARLAGTDRAGRLPEGVADHFPFDPVRMTVGERAAYTPRQLRNRVSRYAEFAARHPWALPASLRAPAFIERLGDDVVHLAARAEAIHRELRDASDHVGLCHWNANVDNAWFRRDADGVLRCGLMDWGCVGRMNLAMALWGALSAAHHEFLSTHLDVLLARFADAYAATGAPPLRLPVLRRQLLLYAGVMGITWLLDAPAYIESRVPQLATLRSRFDAALRDDETARVQLQMLTNVLNLWEAQGLGALLRELQGEQSQA